MSKAAIESIPDHQLTILTRADIEKLADKLVSISVSQVPVIGPADRSNLLLASRTLRRLLAAYEWAADRQLHALVVDGGSV